MTENFNQWWNEDLLSEDNPHVEGTPAFWAWEGWCAAVKAEREACAKVCEKAIASIWEYSPEDVKHTGTNVCNNLAAAIRARGQA